MNASRGVLRGVFATAAVLATCAALAQSYPVKSIRYIVPFPPGGATDIMARNVAQKTSEAWKQSVVVDNRPGGSAMIGADAAAKSPPDGYTWLAMTLTHATNVTLFPQSSYHLLKDLTAVSVLGAMPLVVVVHPGSPARTLSELTALGHKKQLTVGSSGNGTPPHLGLELYRTLTKINLQHVPYKGGAPSLVDLIAGRTDFIVSNLPECITYIKSGRLRPLAITTAARHVLIPDVPTAAEAGLPGFEITNWTGLMVPAGTPKDIVSRIQAEAASALRQPEMTQKVREQGFEVVASAPDAAQAFIASEVERWGKLVREANIKAE
ncbi:MAG: tripartite tricarboxylate transporter substrate binding protein [Betaproteobacteria bacterium]